MKAPLLRTVYVAIALFTLLTPAHPADRQERPQIGEPPAGNDNSEKGFRFRGTTADLLALGESADGYAVQGIAAPLDGTGVILVCALPPERAVLLQAAAKLFNAEWNRGAGPDKDLPNRMGLSVAARAFERRLWTRILTEGYEDLSRLAVLSRKSPAYWQNRFAAPGYQETDPLLPDNNRRFLVRPEWHAQLRLYDSLDRNQRRDLVADGYVRFLPNPAQADLLRQAYTSPGPHYHDAAERTITRKQHLRLVESQVAFWRENSYRLDAARDAVTRRVTGAGPFTLPARDALPLPVRGCPYPDAAGRPRPAPSYADLEKLPFPADLRARSGEDGTAWGQTLAALRENLPAPMLLVSDDYPATEAVRRLAIAYAGRGLRSRPYDPTREVRIPPGVNLAEGLDALCRQTGRVWWRNGNTLYFRSQFWCGTQRYIPLTHTIKQVRSLLARIGLETATAEQSAALAVALSDFSFEQLQGFTALPLLSLPTPSVPSNSPARTAARPLPVTGTAAFLVAAGAKASEQSWTYLQLFRRLSRSQRARALRPEGLPLEAMSADQASLLPAEGKTGADERDKTPPPPPPTFRLEVLSIDGGRVRSPASILPPGNGPIHDIRFHWDGEARFLYLSSPPQ